MVDTFGKGILNPDEEINRQRLAQIVFSQPEALARLKSQMPAEEKMKYADEIIYNDGDISHLESKVTELWHKYSREPL